MSFNIVRTDGTVLTIIQDGELNTTSTSLSLPGRNYPGYGSIIDTNFVHQLENFAFASPPADALRGQLWYNTSTSALYVCPTDGETNPNNWLKVYTIDDVTADLYANSLTLTGNISANNAQIANTVDANLVTADYLTVTVQANISNANVTGLTQLANLRTNSISTGSNTTVGNIIGAWNLNGTLTSNGNVSASGIKTDNYYYSNGASINFDAAAGSSGQVQFNTSNSLDASPDFKFTAANSTVEVAGTIRTVDMIASGLYTGDAGGLSNIPGANVAGTLASSVQSAITQLGTLTSLLVSGNIGAGNINVVSGISATTIAGSLTTNAQPNITSVGTLTNAAITGNVTAGNVYANSGTVSASLLTGTLTTAAQPNITSVGTLTSATVSGNIAAGNLNANAGTVRGLNLAGSLITAAQPNITSIGTLTGLSVSGNISTTNINGTTASFGYISGDGSNLTSLNGANVIGAVGTATVANSVAGANVTGEVGFAAVANSVAGANVTGTVPNATDSVTAGTVTTAAQPNITSVGTLTTLDVSGTITVNQDVNANGVFSGDGSGLFNISAANITGLPNSTLFSETANFVVRNAQPNITSVGTLVSLTVSGNIGAGNINGTHYGSGLGLTTLPGANVTGKVANAVYADVSNISSNTNYANSAGYATSAGNANYATSAGSAATASYATQAGSLSGVGVVAIPNGGTGSANVAGAGQNLGILGWGQTWQNVTSSRALGTVYTNTAGRPIMVYARASWAYTFNASMTGLVGNTEVSYFSAHSDGGTVNFLVPPNATYRVIVNNNAGVTLVNWTELR